MRCLVCDNDIRIATLKQLFSLQPLMICNRCEAGLQPSSSTTLFEPSDVIETIVRRLDQGDLVLLDILKRPFIRLLKSSFKNISSFIVIDSEATSLPYPWLDILVTEVQRHLPKKLSTSGEILYVTRRSQNELKNQIAIF